MKKKKIEAQKNLQIEENYADDRSINNTELKLNVIIGFSKHAIMIDVLSFSRQNIQKSYLTNINSLIVNLKKL